MVGIVVARIVRHKNLLLAVVALSLLWVRWRTATFDPHHARHDAAVEFCESLEPQLEAYRRASGAYPEAIPKEWLADRRIPELIDLDGFYQPSPGRNAYVLRFRDVSTCILPVPCDGTYAFEGSATTTGHWLQDAG